METTNFSTVVNAISADRLMDYTSHISKWVRHSGSDDERKAFNYIGDTLQSWGLSVQEYSPVCLVSLPITASLTLIDTDQEFQCITHSFSATSNGIDGELIYIGNGNSSDYEGIDVQGKIVLTEGSGNPEKAHAAEGSGAIGVLNISPREEIREMIVSPVWGSPTPGTVDQLPTLPHVTVNGSSGQIIKNKLSAGSVRVRMSTQVDTCWKPLPVLVTEVTPEQPMDDTFVLLSGHVDSWHYGAIDNGTANATQLETIRVLLQHRDLLKRNVRVAFWSGHSHARYATSAWYVDEHFFEIRDKCVAHVNIDGPGARGATDLTKALTMAESYDLAKEVIRDISGQALDYHRMQRMGDQSLWGTGAASFYVSISSPGPDGTMEWHHTPLDTMDYIDPEILKLDGMILAGTVYRLASDSLLPLNQARVVHELQTAIADIIAISDGQFDLTMVENDIKILAALVDRLYEHGKTLISASDIVKFNSVIMQLGTYLMTVNYTTMGPYEQDLALDGPGSLPGLRPATYLPRHASNAPERFLLETQLRRQRNRVQDAVQQAQGIVTNYLSNSRLSN